MQQLPEGASPVGSLRATRAVIHLDALTDNIRTFRRLAPTSELIAVVKGDAYGHGSVPVAEAALRTGAGRLAVYTVDEGMALRAAGISAPILLFGPLEDGEAIQVVEAGLSPTIANVEGVRRLERASGGTAVDVHIKVDTGLTRAGAQPREAVALARLIARHPTLRLASVYTHFARADEADPTPTLDQLRVLRETLEHMEVEGIRVPLVHASNTAGALNVPAARLGAIRVGIGLYGYDPSRGRCGAPPLRPVLTLHSRVARVTPIAPGTGVGYGHEFRAAATTVIGLVPIGYGDGLPRQLGLGRGRVLIRGRASPIVGRVSMDQITVDLTGIDEARVGDEVVLIGESGESSQTADDLGDQSGTIGYDIVTGLLPRVPRVYVSCTETVGFSRMGRYEPVAASGS
jgi:alanine racemase